MRRQSVSSSPKIILLTNTIYPSMLTIKTQLIKFYKSPNPVSASPRFIFLGQTLSLSNSISHLGHILTYNLSMMMMMMTFVPSPKTCVAKLIVYYTLSLVVTICEDCFQVFASLYMVLPFGDLRALEVPFNNILHKIWSLPRHSHTGLVHSVA